MTRQWVPEPTSQKPDRPPVPAAPVQPVRGVPVLAPPPVRPQTSDGGQRERERERERRESERGDSWLWPWVERAWCLQGGQWTVSGVDSGLVWLTSHEQ